ncbi:MAG TPA: hypothetical protein VEJ86_06780 [Candidatus Binataceae bacterium]|nr:hypothetical protein [Candidatus Binataceae bacterium]
MVRDSAAPTALALQFARIMSWLLPPGGLVRAPLRSVARELEEQYPRREL